jgi:Glucose-6-phosphate dehydrogenase subunit
VQLVEMVDRLVVDSAEWPDVHDAYADLAGSFDRVAVSDIAWRRTLPWRTELAKAWPELPRELAGPSAEAALVAAWLRSRAGVEVAVVASDSLPFDEQADPSDLLSDELDAFGRDPVYESAVNSAGLP